MDIEEKLINQMIEKDYLKVTKVFAHMKIKRLI